MRAGLARATKSPYSPLPTAYDALFPDGTLLTAPTRPRPRPPLPEKSPDDAGEPPGGAA